MSLRVVLTRHGETEWHEEDRYAGVSNVALTPHGTEQARHLARWAATADIDVVWCSPMTRSLETAKLSAERIGVPVRVDDRLREVDFGIAEGLSRAELFAKYPEEMAAFLHDPVVRHFPEGEHPGTVAERFASFLQDLVAAGHSGRHLVVAHSTAIRLALCHLIGLPLPSYRRVFPHVGNCTLNEIAIDANGTSLLSLNRQALPEGAAS